ncbi:glycosyltransferase [Actinomycetospora sp. TBRC 11914]|uniref:glycosyltransferase n=1 Tax=Actinomycetospora sp. TBRC 11914 TaxID=2729387 RepID=UPI00145D58A0|nr:glycosyltransferase [Actinomycetospora sp. TBRC 11914]NMO90436.1 glycosyltransferase family 4 protein [Actinomycetospora sp. TBRC 11914]
MRVAWLTDAQAPYREPLFCELASRCDFHVHFLFAEEPERHFVYRAHSGYSSAVLPSVRIPLPRRIASRLDSYQAALRPGWTRRVLDAADVVVIPTWAQVASAWTMLRARRRGVPYVIFSESTLDSRQFDRGPIAWLRTRLFTRAGAVVVPGPSAREAALHTGVAPDRIVESVNSVDLEAFGTRPRELRAGRGAGPGAAHHRFVVVGQLIARKNVGTLLEAFAALDGAPTLDVAGDGVLRDELEAAARALGVADRVTFHGFLDEAGVVEVLARTQTLVLPSTEEVYGFTALEAQVAGLQVVVSARAGIAENLADTAGAWVVEPDVEGVRQGLEAARTAWTGWTEEIPAEAASPKRAADDVLAGALRAREH